MDRFPAHTKLSRSSTNHNHTSPHALRRKKWKNFVLHFISFTFHPIPLPPPPHPRGKPFSLPRTRPQTSYVSFLFLPQRTSLPSLKIETWISYLLANNLSIKDRFPRWFIRSMRHFSLQLEYSYQIRQLQGKRMKEICEQCKLRVRTQNDFCPIYSILNFQSNDKENEKKKKKLIK